MENTCIICNKFKKIVAHSKCAACLQKEYRIKYPDRVAASSKRSYNKNISRRRAESRGKDDLKILFRSVRNTSKKRGYACDITFEDLRKIFTKTSGGYLANCMYCKSTIVVGYNATIDHVDSNIKFFKNNMVPACKYCNSSKQCKSSEEHLQELTTDNLLSSNILNNNQKSLKAWLVSECWKGNFEELVNKLYNGNT